MMPERLKAISVDQECSIRNALDIISNATVAGAQTGMVLVVDESDRLVGIMTDGDVRRGLLRGVTLDDSVDTIMVSDPVTLPASLTPTELVEQIKSEASKRTRLKENKVDKLILMDDDGRVADIASFYDLWYLSQSSTRHTAVIGLGFVGLTLAVALADAGMSVVGVEANQDTAESLRNGKAHFHEVGLDPLLRYHVGRGSMNVVTELDDVDADIFIIAVGTPIDENGEPDLTDVKLAARAVGQRLQRRGLVILRSTVPLSTCRNIVAPIIEAESGMQLGRDIFLAFAPERTIEGKALEELRSLPQIVGGWDRASVQMAANLMRELTPTIVEVESLEAAEMIKLVNNSFRDLSFAFANELALVCDHWNIDATQLIHSANEGYPRNRVPAPSPGVGGICLTKDPMIYASVAREAGIANALPRIGRKINEKMPAYVANRITQFLEENAKELKGAKVLLAGLAFKGQPETSDVRFSSALRVLELLQETGVDIWGFDPVVADDEIQALGITPCDLTSGFDGADAVAILNNHQVFSSIDLYTLLQTMNQPSLFFDGWHIFPPEEITRITGVSYASLGVIRGQA
jgi:UDP-N-acetyl-D-mannosaminuronic acid dehydrogenase